MNPALVAGLASVSALVFLIVGVAIGYWGNSRLNSRAIKATEDALTQQIEQARTRSNEILKESQHRAEEFRKEIETERTNSARQTRRERRDLQRIQRRIDRVRRGIAYATNRPEGFRRTIAKRGRGVARTHRD